MSDRRSQIVIISPVFNEQDNIDYFFGRLCAAIDRCDRNKYTFTLVFTNNRSTDGTLDKLKSLHAAHDWVQYLTLSRNHGYQLSVLSGLTTFEADFYMVCDVDCEDPPEVLLTFLERIEQGGDYVYGIRSNRPDHCLLGKMRAAFYFTLRCLGDYPVVPYMSEFALFRRKVRDNLIRGNSSFPFLRTEVGFGGFDIVGVPYRREERKHGSSHYNYWRNFSFAVAGILSSTTFPLRAIFYTLPIVIFLCLLAALSLAFGASFQFVVISILLIDSIYLLSGVAFSAIYLARIYHNGLGRARFIIDHDFSTLRGNCPLESPVAIQSSAISET